MIELLCIGLAFAEAPGAHTETTDHEASAHDEAAAHSSHRGRYGLATDSLGFKWTTIAVIAGEESRVFHGAGIFMEHEFLPGWEIELSVPLLYNEDAWLLPLDLVLKHSWHPAEALSPFVGVGPVIDLLFSQEKGLLFAPGATFMAGTFLWLGHTFGFDIEVAYSAAWEANHGLVHEIGFGAGPVLHF